MGLFTSYLDDQEELSSGLSRVKITQRPVHYDGSASNNTNNTTKFQHHPDYGYSRQFRNTNNHNKFAVLWLCLCLICIFVLTFYLMLHSMSDINQIQIQSIPSTSRIIVHDSSGKDMSSQQVGGVKSGQTIVARFVNGKLQRIDTKGQQSRQVYYDLPTSNSNVNKKVVYVAEPSNVQKFQPPPPCRYENLRVSGIDVEHDIPMKFPSRQLVIGIAADIDIKNFLIFCGSLRDADITATTIIFVNAPIPNKHQEIANKHNIILLAYNRGTLFPTFLRTYHPSSLRWIFLDWFFTIKDRYYSRQFDYVLSLDIRDSVFQTDPFLLFSEVQYSPPNMEGINGTLGDVDSRLFVFGENRNIPISSCNWNSNWIKDCFSERIFNLVKVQPIVCSGISMGSTIRMVDYFNKMSQIMLNNFPCIANKFPKCERNGVDQGVHNVLVHLDYLAPVTVQYQETFPVVNLQSTPDLMQHFPSEVVDAIRMVKSKRKYAVVHQYDRDPRFQITLGKKYLPWIDWDNPITDWAQTPSCVQNFGVVFGMDLFKGKCDLMAARAMTASACCDVCIRQRAFAWRKYYQQHSRNNVTDEELDPIAQLAIKIVDGNASVSTYPPILTSLSSSNTSTEGPRLCTSFTYSVGVCYLKSCPPQDITVMEKLLENPNFKDISIMSKDAISGYIKAKS